MSERYRVSAADAVAGLLIAAVNYSALCVVWHPFCFGIENAEQYRHVTLSERYYKNATETPPDTSQILVPHHTTTAVISHELQDRMTITLSPLVVGYTLADADGVLERN